MPEVSYKYLDFIRLETTGKTGRWSCATKHGEVLGKVGWYGAWRQYCYFPTQQAVYSAGCLTDIADFLQKQNEQQRNKAPEAGGSNP